MIKKLIIGLVAGLLGVGLVGLTGCTLNQAQIEAISLDAGLASAITWIAYDNPDAAAKAQVSAVLTFIVNDATNVQSGKTYTEVIYPDVLKYVSAKVPVVYQPFADAGALAVLNGIDLLFALHPDWKTDQNKALGVVSSFIKGAQQGLAMPETSKAITQAKSMNATRAKGFKK